MTGDGHFSSAVTFLKMYMDKTVGVLGVKGTLNRQLCDCATWAKILQVYDIDTDEYQRKLILNFENAKRKGIILTFMRTVEYVAERYGGEVSKYQEVLGNMIQDGYVSTVMTPSEFQHSPFRMLVPDWDKIAKLKKKLFKNADKVVDFISY